MTMRRRSLGLGITAVAMAAVRPAAAQEVSGPLVLYTSQLEPDAAGTVEAFRRRHPAVQVEWIRAGTGQIMTRLRAEIAAGNPRPDILLLADSLTFEGLKAEGRLRPSPEVATAGIPAEHLDPGRAYFGTKLITTGIMHHQRAPFVPRRWAEPGGARGAQPGRHALPGVSGAGGDPRAGAGRRTRARLGLCRAAGGRTACRRAAATARSCRRSPARSAPSASSSTTCRSARRARRPRAASSSPRTASPPSPSRPAILSTARNLPAASPS
jgi:iron(III) transport system substrate-binding protein